MLKEITSFFVHRALRLIGGLLVFGSLTLMVFILLLDIIVGLSNPYLGIIAYMILPGFLALGLILVPLDSFLRRRRIRAGLLEEPIHLTLDLSHPRQRALIYFFSISTAVIIMIATIATYKGIEFMDTKTFCGLTCHKIMKPEYVAYSRSPHAGVACVECHIGPGAPWFVRAKLSGLPQVYHYTLKDYERPISTPVAALRPSRDTCENCHWPERFYGSDLRTHITYKSDRDNTMQTRLMIMKVGSGAQKGANIHSHVVQKIWYLPANSKRSEIAWVKVKRVNGTIAEYVLPSACGDLTNIKKKLDVRFMDCIDCHNRSAHNFQPFENLLDLALTEGDIDRTIPYIKKEAMAAVPVFHDSATPELERAPTEAEMARTLRAIEAIPATYQKKYPDVFNTRSTDIAAAAKGIRDVCEASYFPHMHLWAGTYPNWATHEGCFRCHGTLVKVKGKPGETLSRDCKLCHSLPATAGPGVLDAALAGTK